MDKVFCINSNSFPASTDEEAFELFDDAIQGVLQLTNDARPIFVLDTPDSRELSTFLLGPNLDYEQFIKRSEPDLQLFLYEVEDKSPALDSLTDEQIDEVSDYSFYLCKQPLPKNTTVLSLAWVLSGYLLSIQSCDPWSNLFIDIGRVDEEGKFINEPSSQLKNVASVEHGKLHLEEETSFDLSAKVDPHTISEYFYQWFDTQQEADKERIKTKLLDAVQKEFQGGKPLFDTIKGEKGLREIRFSASSGGAIRVLFRHISNNQYAILTGFIKKGTSEHYTSEIDRANDIYNSLS